MVSLSNSPEFVALTTVAAANVSRELQSWPCVEALSSALIRGCVLLSNVLGVGCHHLLFLDSQMES